MMWFFLAGVMVGGVLASLILALMVMASGDRAAG